MSRKKASLDEVLVELVGSLFIMWFVYSSYIDWNAKQAINAGYMDAMRLDCKVQSEERSSNSKDRAEYYDQCWHDGIDRLKD